MSLEQDWLLARCLPNKKGCWIWQLSVTQDGYGRCGFLGCIYLTHRLSKYLFGEANAEQIRDANIVFRHKCDTPRCVNPSHIILGSQLDNIKDREAKGRGRKGEQVWSARLTPDDVRAIRSRYTPKNAAKLAKEFNTSLPNLKAIIYRQKWKHVK